MIKYDGQTYADESEIPDFGSIVCVNVVGDKREYIGYVTDESKLPKYDNLGNDSSATLYNTSGGIEKILSYFAKDKKWIEK